MPYGLAHTPSVFQAFINDVLHNMLVQHVFVFINDRTTSDKVETLNSNCNKLWLLTRDLEIRLNSHKPSVKYVGPFRIIREIHPVIYSLDLLRQYCICCFLFPFWFRLPWLMWFLQMGVSGSTDVRWQSLMCLVVWDRYITQVWYWVTEC